MARVESRARMRRFAPTTRQESEKELKIDGVGKNTQVVTLYPFSRVIACVVAVNGRMHVITLCTIIPAAE